jgi:2-polyprenyl-3-methyl-5-hydroxy-6-metoxy-1,4-benzoquinol methylase
MKEKTEYFISSFRKRILSQGLVCPSCGSEFSDFFDSKYIVTELRRCNNCHLLFRTPTTSKEENYTYYQNEYSLGFTTDCPTNYALKQLIDQGFKNTEKDYSIYLSILDGLGAKSGMKLLDYGCSWGYGSWQFQQAKYQVTSFEISKPRCSYAREKLGINAKDSLDEIVDEFDIIFSSHVIEHLPSVVEYLDFATQRLRHGGMLITVSPNGSEEFFKASPREYRQLWGLNHPQMLDEKFYIRYFGELNLLITSNPYSIPHLKSWNKSNLLIDNLSGSELLCVWCKI